MYIDTALSADGGWPQLVFHKAIRHLMGVPPLTRTEERVALLRTAGEVAEVDRALGAQLRHDVAAWQEALAELDERGIDPATGLASVADEMVQPRVAEFLATLHAGRRRHAPAGPAPFELAARAFLAGPFLRVRRVVMEGLTFLRPLQDFFARRCAEQGAEVVFLHPRRAEQAHGFAVMRRTFDRFVPRSDRAPIATPLAAEPGTALLALQSQLFTEPATAPPPADNTVTLESYGHRHAEVAACVRRLRDYLDSGTAPDQIAVVVRGPALESLLQEEAARHDPPVPLSIPPRLLLLTPVGRFALALYEVWSNGGLDLSSEAFLALLNSGWLGAEAQDAADHLEALTAHFFARCRSRGDWAVAFAQVRHMRASLTRGGESRLPAGDLPERVVQTWERALDRAQRLCEQLFAAPRQSIGEHVRWLQDVLNRLAVEELFRREREVVERIHEALAAVATATSMPVTAPEFAAVLTALAREYEQAAEDHNEAPGRVGATTPEGIDNSPRDVVFYLGADNHRAPRPLPSSWPFERSEVESHAECERYLFLAVVRSAGRRLHLSLARHEQGHDYLPSPYLEEAARVLGQKLNRPVPRVPAAPAAPAGEPPVAAARRREYDLPATVRRTVRRCPVVVAGNAGRFLAGQGRRPAGRPGRDSPPARRVGGPNRGRAVSQAPGRALPILPSPGRMSGPRSVARRIAMNVPLTRGGLPVTSQQAAVVDAVLAQPVTVVGAGAGSGKTHTRSPPCWH